MKIKYSGNRIVKPQSTVRAIASESGSNSVYVQSFLCKCKSILEEKPILFSFHKDATTAEETNYP